MNFRHKHIFLLPGLLVLIGILIFPILFTVRLSLSSWDSFYPGLDFIGLENYIRLFTDDLRFWESFLRLGFLSLTTVFLQYVIGFSLALMVWRDIAFKRFFRVLFLIPMMSTPLKFASRAEVKKILRAETSFPRRLIRRVSLAGTGRSR